MNTAFTAVTSIGINAAREYVWEALTTPDIIKQYLFGATVISDWRVGSSIIYKGEWEGTPYEDKGTILTIEPNKCLQATYYSPLSGLDDTPANYNTVTYVLSSEAGQTRLVVTQTNNPSQAAADQAEANWRMTLDAMKTLLEQ